MSEKRNSRDHKRRLLAAKFELRRKLYKAFCKDPDLPSDMRDKHRYKLSKLPRNKIVPLHESETDVFPRVALVLYLSSFEFLVSFFVD
uniref:ribosomal protein S14 n=1 Tax=Lepidium apetalum TaxID=153459 RepID=UPI00315DDC4C